MCSLYLWGWSSRGLCLIAFLNVFTANKTEFGLFSLGHSIKPISTFFLGNQTQQSSFSFDPSSWICWDKIRGRYGCWIKGGSVWAHFLREISSFGALKVFVKFLHGTKVCQKEEESARMFHIDKFQNLSTLFSDSYFFPRSGRNSLDET